MYREEERDKKSKEELVGYVVTEVGLRRDMSTCSSVLWYTSDTFY